MAKRYLVVLEEASAVPADGHSALLMHEGVTVGTFRVLDTVPDPENQEA
jgi:hypothetical protein